MAQKLASKSIVDDKTLAPGKHRRNFAPLDTLAVRTIDRKGPPYTNYSFPFLRTPTTAAFRLMKYFVPCERPIALAAPPLFIFTLHAFIFFPTFIFLPLFLRLHFVHFSSIFQNIRNHHTVLNIYRDKTNWFAHIFYTSSTKLEINLLL